ncbi:MAG: hypothetical protein RLZZ188_3348, partial [Verrucomicrobiota bacterium]
KDTIDWHIAILGESAYRKILNRHTSYYRSQPLKVYLVLLSGTRWRLSYLRLSLKERSPGPRRLRHVNLPERTEYPAPYLSSREILLTDMYCYYTALITDRKQLTQE